jgi:hypothetical protein
MRGANTYLGCRSRRGWLGGSPRMPAATVVDGDWPGGLHRAPWMAGIAQLVERQVVVLDVTGSSPVARPRRYPGTRSRGYQHGFRTAGYRFG